ncbi:hypothetical protein LA76x_3087 [Lysobacter antibioticus]|uniref:Uncharacterized protein n=1 Tax=Lysobacter antibioticus TaxID=84531 RepID=A0A0S2FCD8_LYSAN|nr:hypothetical protein LA76x_3087 [Lysobacter antibioticus]
MFRDACRDVIMTMRTALNRAVMRIAIGYRCHRIKRFHPCVRED